MFLKPDFSAGKEIIFIDPFNCQFLIYSSCTTADIYYCRNWTELRGPIYNCKLLLTGDLKKMFKKIEDAKTDSDRDKAMDPPDGAHYVDTVCE